MNMQFLQIFQVSISNKCVTAVWYRHCGEDILPCSWHVHVDDSVTSLFCGRMHGDVYFFRNAMTLCRCVLSKSDGFVSVGSLLLLLVYSTAECSGFCVCEPCEARSSLCIALFLQCLQRPPPRSPPCPLDFPRPSARPRPSATSAC